MKLIVLERELLGEAVLSAGSDKKVTRFEWKSAVGALDALALLSQAALSVVVLYRQQPGDTLETLRQMNEAHSLMHRQVQKAGARIEGIWFCRHHEGKNDGCDQVQVACNLLLDMFDRLGVKPSETWVTGESVSLMEAALSLNANAAYIAGSFETGLEAGAVTRTETVAKGLPAAGESLAEVVVFKNIMAFAEHAEAWAKEEGEVLG